METKKAFEADLENEKSSMFLMGLLVALCASFIVIEWSNRDVKNYIIPDEHGITVIEDDYAPVTVSTPPPPVVEEPKIADPVFKKDINAETKVTPITGEMDPTAETPDKNILDKPIEVPVEVDPDANVIYNFKNVDKKAEYAGGMAQLRKDLASRLVYPKGALESGISGTVVVKFVVETDGSISDISVIREIDPMLDREAVRVVKTLTGWTPAMRGTKKVRQVFTLPVQFVAVK